MNPKLLKRIVLNKGALWISYLKLLPILKKVGKDAVIIDCGANVGDITRKFAITGAHVYAFEPDPLAFEILRERTKSYSNVTLFKKGVWDKNALLELYSHKDQDEQQSAYTVSSSIVGNKMNINTSKAHSIEVIDLTEFIENLGKRVTLVKLDVEGAETEILKKVIQKETYKLFNAMFVETHETKIPGQHLELDIIKKKMQEKSITNIHLNWL